MNFGNFLVIFYGTMFIIRFIELFLFRKRQVKGKTFAKWTIGILGIGYITVIGCSLLEYYIKVKNINGWVTGIGFLLMAFRFLIKYWAIRTLDKYWSSDLEIRENHKLIKKGLYKYLRHPVYFGRLIDVISIPLIANSYYTLILAILLHLVLLNIRIRIEEKVLIEKFGKDYVEYKKHTWGLIPGLK